MESWVEDVPTTNFWLAGHEAVKRAIKNNGGFALDGSLVLYQGEIFASVMSLSPWLIPLSESLQRLPSSCMQQGILLTSSVSANTLLAHLQSLLIASSQGEEVLFRFYDIAVISPMLSAMTEHERNAFLGPIQQLSLWRDDHWQHWHNTCTAPVSLQPAPWWKIQPRHLADLYKVEQHAFSIERRLWAMCPTMMEKVVAPQSMIIEGLAAAQQHGLTAEQAEMLVLRTLQKHTLTAEDELVTVFRFTQAEYETFLHIEEKLA